MFCLAKRKSNFILSIPGPLQGTSCNSFSSSVVAHKHVSIHRGKRKKGKGKNADPNSAPGPLPKTPGAFKPLPSSQLTNPLFEDKSDIIFREFPPLERSAMGQVAQFPDTKWSPMINFGLPRNILVDFRLMAKPCSVVREDTVTLAREMDRAAEESSAKHRSVLTGSAGCGKSYLMLQTVTHCAKSGWVVLYIPRAQNFVNSTTSYFYDPRTQTYFQPIAAFQNLQRLLNANFDTLTSLRLQKSVELDKRNPLPEGISFAEVIEIGLKDATLAPNILSIVLEELGKQEQYPVLFAVDDFQALYCDKTIYRDAEFSHIRPWHMSMPRLIMDYASGKKTFARGAFLGALSCQNTQFPLELELREGLQLPHDRPTSPYVRRHPALVEYAHGLKSIPISEKLSQAEATAIFEMWMAEKVFHSKPTDTLFLSKYSESCGNARDFVRGGLLAGLTL
ncbi:hypothetical protein BD410DRAFT_787085 [Rickenella mellea]|uniref:Small ribosomal subunit protein mS29 n=1 Tax=Rickenella mellea TaxID=50990 RepID=A0A4Y7Q8N2_9AGAM|nr:hypothetical protein BD410DRAFT_787085 [Rickenella mellea]